MQDQKQVMKFKYKDGTQTIEMKVEGSRLDAQVETFVGMLRAMGYHEDTLKEFFVEEVL